MKNATLIRLAACWWAALSLSWMCCSTEPVHEFGLVAADAGAGGAAVQSPDAQNAPDDRGTGGAAAVGTGGSAGVPGLPDSGGRGGTATDGATGGASVPPGTGGAGGVPSSSGGAGGRAPVEQCPAVTPRDCGHAVGSYAFCFTCRVQATNLPITGCAIGEPGPTGSLCVTACSDCI